VSSWRSLTTYMALSALATSPSAASSGDIGATSRSSVIISVTIPKHMHAVQLSAPQSTFRPGEHAICVVGAGRQDSFTMTLMPGQADPEWKLSDGDAVEVQLVNDDGERESVSLTPGSSLHALAASNVEHCGDSSGRGMLTLVANHLPGKAPPDYGQLTVLIAAD
jgi:hypothetical protein